MRNDTLAASAPQQPCFAVISQVGQLTMIDTGPSNQRFTLPTAELAASKVPGAAIAICRWL